MRRVRARRRLLALRRIERLDEVRLAVNGEQEHLDSFVASLNDSIKG